MNSLMYWEDMFLDYLYIEGKISAEDYVVFEVLNKTRW